MATQNDNTMLNKGDLKAYHQKILPYLGGNMMMNTNNSSYYSTDEKVVGVWTDGRPLYQKTINIPLVNAGMASAYVMGDSSSILRVQNCITTASDDNHTEGNHFLYSNFDESGTGYTWGNGYVMITADGQIRIQCTDDWNGYTAHCTVQYTKTTDVAGSITTIPGVYDINLPSTWKENTEVYFGNGLYGYRFTGNFTTAISTGSNTWTEVAKKPTGLITIRSFISCGGNLEAYTTSGIQKTPACVPRGNNLDSCVYITGLGVFRVLAISPTGSAMSIRTTDKYDVWITYTK